MAPSLGRKVVDLNPGFVILKITLSIAFFQMLPYITLCHHRSHKRET